VASIEATSPPCRPGQPVPFDLPGLDQRKQVALGRGTGAEVRQPGALHVVPVRHHEPDRGVQIDHDRR
jgi:hypothetical protein